MKRRIAVLAAVFALAVGMLGGCGNNAQPAADSTKAEENSMDTSAQDEIVKDTADEAQQPSDDVQIPALEDGIYDAEFNTDSSMFHVNEANDGRGGRKWKDDDSCQSDIQAHCESVCGNSRGCPEGWSRDFTAYYGYRYLQ